MGDLSQLGIRPLFVLVTRDFGLFWFKICYCLQFFKGAQDSGYSYDIPYINIDSVCFMALV